MNMKKKITALVLAVSAAMGATAFAQQIKVQSSGDTRAILACYNENGTLVYTTLAKSEDGSFDIDVPEEYADTKKRIYFTATKKLTDVTEETQETPTLSPSEEPQVTPSPTVTPEPETTSSSDYPSIYEKAVDAVYAPALVKDVEMRVNDNGEDIFAVTMFYLGKEVTVGIESGFTITSAPTEYSYMKGKTVDSLEKGDVITITTNVAGNKVKTLDFIFRPTEEDIATGDTDYGTNFENLFSAGGIVAGKWSVMKYGEKPSSDRYQYAFGIVGIKNGNSLTLINKQGDADISVDVDFTSDTIVYTCDVSGKEYDVDISDVSAIETTIPKNSLNNGPVELNDDYSYNYALVRVVDNTATDIILYNNYND
jgi:hypothetical protein